MEALNVLLLVFILVCAVAVSVTKDLLTSIIIFMAQSVAMSVVWILLRAPDLASEGLPICQSEDEDE